MSTCFRRFGGWGAPPPVIQKSFWDEKCSTYLLSCRSFTRRGSLQARCWAGHFYSITSEVLTHAAVEVSPFPLERVFERRRSPPWWPQKSSGNLMAHFFFFSPPFFCMLSHCVPWATHTRVIFFLRSPVVAVFFFFSALSTLNQLFFSGEGGGLFKALSHFEEPQEERQTLHKKRVALSCGGVFLHTFNRFFSTRVYIQHTTRQQQ